MLILTRRAGERIVIGDDVVVTIVEAGRDHVRVGIEAPRSVSVHRYEVYAEIARENEAARAGELNVEPDAASDHGAPVSAASLARRPRER